MSENEPTVNPDSLLDENIVINPLENQNENDTSMREIPLTNEENNKNENNDNQQNNNNELTQNIQISDKEDIRNIRMSENNINNNNNNTNNNIDKENKTEETKETNKYSTLDETVGQTLLRDLKTIGHKIKYVLIPKFESEKNKELENWDLWGPLLICLILCIILSSGNEQNDSTFTAIFAIVWIGGFIINLNAQFLGAKIGFFQILCLLGYCLFPILICSIIFIFFPSNNNILYSTIKISLLISCVIWSCISSVGFISALVPKEKKFIISYPIYIFFISISMFVLNA